MRSPKTSQFRRRVRLRANPALMLLALAAAVVLVLRPGPGRAASLDDYLAISEDQELALGKELAQQVQKKLPMLYDAAIVSYVNRLGQRMAQASARPNLVYTFRVVDVAEPNAFALPGGHVFVQRGLLDTVSTEMELAGVLAHEVGHVAGRHGAKQVGRLRLLEAGAGLLSEVLGGKPAQGQGQGQGQGNQPDLTQLAINLLASGVLLKYSREQEHEADDLGFTTMVRAGYDPRGLILFFQMLLARRQENPNAFEQLFATHPPSRDRIQALSARWWAERPPNLQVDSEEFRRMRAHLATLPPPKPMPKDPPQSPRR